VLLDPFSLQSKQLQPYYVSSHDIYNINKEQLYSSTRQKSRSEARSVFSCWAVRELGVEETQMAKSLMMSQPGISYAVGKGERIVKDRNLQMRE